MSNVINREQCPVCASRGQDSSRDNLAIYDDGHKYCYSCSHDENGKMKKAAKINIQQKY